MRRKSDRTKEKDKETPEKKSTRRSSRRHSKRRKRSHSSSPEVDDSGAEDIETQCKSIKVENRDEKQEDSTGSNGGDELNKPNDKDVTVSGAKIKSAICEDEWKEDTAFWSEDTPKEACDHENTEVIAKKSPVEKVESTDVDGHSVPEAKEENTLEPKSKRPERARRRSNTSCCEDGDAAGDENEGRDDEGRDDEGRDDTSIVENEEQSEKTGNDTENEAEVERVKQENDSFCYQVGHSAEEDRENGREVGLNKEDAEGESRSFTEDKGTHREDSGERVSVNSDLEEVKTESLNEVECVESENTVEKENSSYSSGDKSEAHSDESLQKDTSEVIGKEEEILHSVSSCLQEQISTVQESDRETYEESAVHLHDGDNSISCSSSVTVPKEDAELKESGSGDSTEFQESELKEECEQPEELEKSESLDERKENGKCLISEKAISSFNKQPSLSDDSSRDASPSSKENLDTSHCTLDETGAQKTNKSHMSGEEVQTTSGSDYVASDRLKTGEEEKVKPKRVKLCRTSRDSSHSVPDKTSESHSPDAHEHCKPSKLDRQSHSPDSLQRNLRRDSDSFEAHSPSHPKDRILLRRSFSEKSTVKADSDKRSDSCDETETNTSTDHKDDKENEKLSIDKDAGSISRKRRWGASKTSRAGKKPVLSISSDSLKNLIPGAKPVPAGEVQLTGDDKDAKIDIEESWSSKTVEEEKLLVRPLVMLPDIHKSASSSTDDHSRLAMRKISIVSDDARNLQRSPSPPRHKVSDILFITNLVRPFTVNQLKELLARTGTIIEDGFWIDKIKSKCYVQYETEEQAQETRHALHGVRWPVSNPKQLCVDFGRREDMETAKAASETENIPRKTDLLHLERVPPESIPASVPLVEDWKAVHQMRDKDRERERDRDRDRDKDRARTKDRPGASVHNSATYEQRIQKVPPTVREWDLGKIGQMSPERDGISEERTKDRERKVRKDKTHRSRSISPADSSGRKIKKKEDDAPAKLLDDLFRKTKITPCIYWLPLTAEQEAHQSAPTKILGGSCMGPVL